MSKTSEHVTVYQRLDGYQRNAADLALKARQFALFFEQGTGKTWIAGAVIERSLHEKFTGLVVVPLANLESTWLAFLSTNIPQVALYRDFDEYRAAKTPKLFLCHYEGLAAVTRLLLRSKFDLIVYDEAQRLKARATGASRLAYRLRHAAEIKLILSGTPIDKQPEDLWAQFRFMKPELLGTNWKQFVDRWFTPEDTSINLRGVPRNSLRFQKLLKAKMIRNSKRTFDRKHLPIFLELIQPHCLRVTKEVLDLPPLHLHERCVRLWGNQARLYADMERDFIVRLGEDAVTAPLKVTQLTKLHQIVGGHLIDENGIPHKVGRAKEREAVSLVKRLAGPIVMFFRYTEEVHAMVEALSKIVGRVECLTGRTKKKLRPSLIRDFQAGEIDVLLCQIKTGGVGIDLFRSSTAIFYSFPYSFIDFEQAVARVHRRGQENEVNIYLILAEATIDYTIYQAILDKRSVVDEVLNNLKEKQHDRQEVRREGGKARRAGSEVRR